jgi:hypothetical protein
MSNESENEEYLRYCVIEYKPSIQEEYKKWANTDEDFLAPDYELIVWGEECGQTQIVSLNRASSNSLSWQYVGGSELYDFYYTLWDNMKDVKEEVMEEVEGILANIFTEQPVMKRDPFIGFVA